MIRDNQLNYVTNSRRYIYVTIATIRASFLTSRFIWLCAHRIKIFPLFLFEMLVFPQRKVRASASIHSRASAWHSVCRLAFHWQSISKALHSIHFEVESFCNLHQMQAQFLFHLLEMLKHCRFKCFGIWAMQILLKTRLYIPMMIIMSRWLILAYTYSVSDRKSNNPPSVRQHLILTRGNSNCIHWIDRLIDAMADIR